MANFEIGFGIAAIAACSGPATAVIDLIPTGSRAELPLPPGERRGIKVGQTILLEAERLGRLVTRVSEQPFRQPHETGAAPAQ